MAQIRNLATTYDPKDIEDRLYHKWESRKYFHAEVDESKKPFTIVIPPPNITGQLHMGHALDNTLQDILVRWKRMQGYNVLWQPGTDHASIATEAKVLEKMREEGLTKEMVGREGFLKRTWAWKDQYGSRIISQLKKLGASCDWDRERFTMDEGCSKAVKEVFVRLYNKGLIYRGTRMVNWCPHCNTSISDAEVVYEQQQGNFWHLLYTVKETGEKLELATTRPETMLGDTAVAINADDPRYSHLHGCHVILPLLNKEIPIVCDEHADMTKGTGVVKITPAHDPNDYEVGQRHNLPSIRVFTYDGHMTGPEDRKAYEELVASGRAPQGEPEVLDCGKYAGMTTQEARKAIVADLEAGGYLKETEPLTHDVGTCYRCHTNIEPMVSRQWFVRMEPLAKPAIEAVEKGATRFIPERFTKLYMNWMKNTRDWCISRQLWWGHQIPAWYCDDCGETIVAKEAPTVCPKCGSTHLTQDPDTLDTWFSSALWPFSTLGWPDKTRELDYFYPTNVLVTGYDIITFWVSRMIFSGLEYTGQVPFKDVLIHGLVRDANGVKMSKSLGNGIDPLEVIDKYGADALRMMLVTGNAPGNYMRFYWSKVEASRNFANKVWNASRFVLMNMDTDLPDSPEGLEFTDADKWILSKCNQLARDLTDNMDKYELGVAADKLTAFMWEEFCDWYIEMVKPRLYDTSDAGKASRTAALWTLRSVLSDGLKMLHPFMPFITEEIYNKLRPEEETIMFAKWPEYSEDRNFPKEEEAVERMKEAIRGIRETRRQMNVPPKQKADVIVVSSDEKVRRIFEDGASFLGHLAFATKVTVQADMTGIADNAASIPIRDGLIRIPLEQLVDFEKEKARLLKEKKRLEGELKRSAGKLSNKGFLAKAPQSVIEEEKEKAEKYRALMDQVEDSLKKLED